MKRALPRLRLFEFNDAAWAPPALRGLTVDSLGLTLERGRLMDGLVTPFAEFLAAAGSSEVLDLCSGAGGPVRILSQALRARGVAARFTLTDLHPRVVAWERLAEALPDRIRHVAEPVDATAVAAELGRGKARVIINALHHFPPAIVRGIFADAARAGTGIFISESFERNPLLAVDFIAAGVPAVFTSPLRGDDRWLKALLVWATPIAALSSLWDTVVSTLRVYDEAELRSLVADLPQLEWRWGTYPVGRFGRGTWFSGVPRAGPTA